MQSTELRSALRRVDAGDRRRLLNELSDLDEPAMTTLVAHHLGDPLPAVCEAAVAALGRMAGPLTAHAAALGLSSPPR